MTTVVGRAISKGISCTLSSSYFTDCVVDDRYLFTIVRTQLTLSPEVVDHFYATLLVKQMKGRHVNCRIYFKPLFQQHLKII